MTAWISSKRSTEAMTGGCVNEEMELSALNKSNFIVATLNCDMLAVSNESFIA